MVMCKVDLQYFSSAFSKYIAANFLFPLNVIVIIRQLFARSTILRYVKKNKET